MAYSDSIEAQSELSKKLVFGKIIAGLLDIEPDKLEWDKSFILLGGDSILAIDFIVKCRDAGIHMDMKELLTAESLNELAEKIDQSTAGAVNGVETNGVNGHGREVNGHSNGINGHANGINGHANGINGHAKNVNGHVNGTNGHANGTNGHATSENGSDDLTASMATVGRRLRFASMDIAQNKEPSVILNALQHIVDRHSALRSTWFVSSTGHWTLKAMSKSATEGNRLFYFAEASETAQLTDVVNSVSEALLTAGGPSFGCLVMPKDEPEFSQIIVLAADANIADDLSMRHVLRELDAAIRGRYPEPTFEFQFSDWATQHLASLQSSLRGHDDETDVTKSKSAAHISALKMNGHAQSLATFQLSHSTTQKLFAAQTHDSLRTSPVDIVNAALSNTMLSHSPSTEDVLIIKTVYSTRDEHNIPFGSIGCYETEMELEVRADEPRENLTHVVRRVRDARAGFSGRAPMQGRNESALVVYVDCTRLQNIKNDLSSRSWWASNPVQDHNAHITVEMIAGQVQFSLQLDGTTMDHERIAIEFQRCLEDVVDELIPAPQMATLRDFPLIHWQYSELDDLTMELQTHGIALDDIESIAPCSAVQESFFVSQAINPASYVSNVSIRLLSTSVEDGCRLETERIVDAWKDTVKRHAMLRTTFVESHDRPGKFDQLVLKPRATSPRIFVCRSPSDASTIPAFTTGKFESPQRLCVCEISAEELRLDLEISHALVDGHSAKILLHDFRAGYLRAAHFSEQPPLPYTIFASQQQVALSTGNVSAGAAYWTSYLNGASQSHLPLVTSNPRLHRLETARCSVPLASGKLRAVCGRFAITPANLFHVAWALAIRRIALSDSITFSYIVSGRNSNVEGAEATVGPLLNTLPCALTLTSETSVADALSLAKLDWQQGLPHQNIPIADLPVAKTRSLKRLGNTLLSIERETTNSHAFIPGTSMTIDARTSATDVRSC
jgi:aryl carrier-like protein